MSLTTQIFENEYAQENEVLALLEESQFQYKWGGPLGTVSTVTTVLQVPKLLLDQHTLLYYLIHLLKMILILFKPLF